MGRAKTLDDQVIEDLEWKVAKLARELDSARRGHRYWYERNRKLENAIREMNEKDTDIVVTMYFTRLMMKIPINPRKTWRELYSGGKNG